MIDTTPTPSPTPNPTPPSNPISDNATVQMPPVSIPPAQGKLQLWLVAWFGPSYQTTLSGYTLGLGGTLTSIGLILGVESKWGKALTIAGSIIGVLGGQQLGQHAKSTKVTGVEPK